MAVAPMSRVSADYEGVPTPAMLEYYTNFAAGGFGLIITEGVFTDDYYSKAYDKQPGLTTLAQAEGWKKITASVKPYGSSIICQLMHAGALSQFLKNTIAPSAIQPLGRMMPEMDGQTGPYRLPVEMTLTDIRQIKEGYVKAAQLAEHNGFDGIEIHAANGYLFDQFITEYTNIRNDEYGGSVINRLRLLVEIFTAIREQVSPSLIVGIRFSEGKVNNLSYRWPRGAGTASAIFSEIKKLKPDYIHIAAEGGKWERECAYPDGRSSNQIARQLTGATVIANGGLHEIQLAARLINEQHADIVAIGKTAIANPNWPQLIKRGENDRNFVAEMIHPYVTLENTSAYLTQFPERLL